MRIFIITLITIFSYSCSSQDCMNMEEGFTSYEQAIKTVQSTSFSFEDKVNTSTSSWIKSAQYFSCNGKTGYLIIRTRKNKSYIYDHVPIDVWNEFKNASSFGTFYNNRIKGRYKLKL